MAKGVPAELTCGTLRVLSAVVLGAIIGGTFFAGLDFVRTFGVDAATQSVAGTSIEAVALPEGLLGGVASFIEWYSTTFSGYSRFGSGIGIILGATWAIGPAKKYAGVSRITIGALSGFFIGLRLAMFITSKPPLVLGCAILWALFIAAYVWIAGRPSQFRPLPRLQFKHQP